MIADTELLDALAVAIYTTDADGRITFYNQSAADLWGHRPELGSAQWCGSWRLYWPDGRPMRHDECPMAVTLKEGRPVRGVEAIAERPDGTRVWFVPYPTPLRDGSGRLVGAINLLIDITERYQRELESVRLAAIVASSDDAIISKTLDGLITSWNAGAARIFGYEASEMIGQSITRIIPPELYEEEQQILAQLKRGEHIDHYETIRLAKNGRRLDISVTVSPLRDKWGRIVGASKVSRDITERKDAEKLQRLLIDELNHRVKNTLATIQAVANQSLRRAKSPDDFVASFTGRVQALAKANTLLTHTSFQGAELMDLVSEQVLLGRADDNRISCSGPRLMLGSQVAIHLALILHELATNARKYGALSVPNGHLSVIWEVRTNGGRNLFLQWTESGGPNVTAPAERGFGTTLLEQALQAHGGEASIRYAANGVTGEIKIPLPEQDQPRLGFAAAAWETRIAPPMLELHQGGTSLRGKRILVIEDEPLVSMDLEASLRSAGFEVIGPAGNLGAAKRLIADAQFDAALLDVNLAGHPVDELAALLINKSVPFAFVTGYGREALPSAFGDAVVLGKPFNQDQLLAVVERLFYQDAGVVQLRRKQV